jgi:hypothetical protein
MTPDPQRPDPEAAEEPRPMIRWRGGALPSSLDPTDAPRCPEDWGREGMSQRAVAEALGISQKKVAAIEAVALIKARAALVARGITLEDCERGDI